MDRYLTYKEYKKMGGTLQEPPFNILSAKAQKQVDEATYGRLIGSDEVASEVKYCIYELIDINNKIDTASSKASESIDGYSITYNTAMIETKSKIKGTIKSWLSGLTDSEGTPLTYAGGVHVNERKYYYIP